MPPRNAAVTVEPGDQLTHTGTAKGLTPQPKLAPKKRANLTKQQQEDMRAYQGAELRLAGADWFTIATALGFKSTKDAMEEVMGYVKRFYTASPDDIAMAMDVEMARLDALQSSYWQQATEGHLPSAHFCLDLIKVRANMRGIAITPSVVQQNNTIVVGGAEKDYVSALKNLRAQSEQVIDGEVVR